MVEPEFMIIQGEKRYTNWKHTYIGRNPIPIEDAKYYLKESLWYYVTLMKIKGDIGNRFSDGGRRELIIQQRQVSKAEFYQTEGYIDFKGSSEIRLFIDNAKNDGSLDERISKYISNLIHINNHDDIKKLHERIHKEQQKVINPIKVFWR